MQFELTKELVAELKAALDDGNTRAITETLAELHPADTAEIIQQFHEDDAHIFFDLLPKEKRAEVYLELDEDWRLALLDALDSEDIANELLPDIDSDDAADLISVLPEKQQIEVLDMIDDVERVDHIKQLMRYPEDSAGGIMAKELVKVNADWTISQGIREMRKQAQEVSEVYSVYVVDNKDKLLGTLSLQDMLFSPNSIKSKFRDIHSDGDLQYVLAHDSAEEAARMMEKYDLVALPVVDEEMRLLGRITIDDVVDVMKEEAERDYQMASGLAEKVDLSDNVAQVTRARLPWLLIGLLGGLLVSNVVGFYEDEIATVTQLALFMPLIAAMGGNVGVQSSAIVVQGLANSSINIQALAPRLLKEFYVAAISGSICAILVIGYNLIFLDSIMLGLTVGLALFSVIIFAALFGTFVPLTLEKLKIDPAVATGPFITTVNDIMGLAIYFIVAQEFFNL